jgi:hypothetical protein
MMFKDNSVEALSLPTRRPENESDTPRPAIFAANANERMEAPWPSRKIADASLPID